MPLSRLPAGCEGFHVVGLGDPGSWSSLKPESNDKQDWDNVREWTPEMLASVYLPEPKNDTLFRNDGLYSPRIPDAVELYQTTKYRAGACLRYPWSSDNRTLEAIQALNSATHPALCPPAQTNGFPEVLQVPGQLQLTPSVPLVVWSPEKEHLSYEQTIAAVHTCQSAKGIPGVPDDLDDICCSIAKNVLGNPAAEDERDRKPYYELDLGTNMRHSGARTFKYEGSYSLAATTGEGQGPGMVQPAAQKRNEYVEGRQRVLLYDVGERDGCQRRDAQPNAHAQAG